MTSASASPHDQFFKDLTWARRLITISPVSPCFAPV
jgi:hypothetical protein